MLKYAVLSLVVILVSIFFFGSKMKSVQANKADRVSAVEQFMSN